MKPDDLTAIKHVGRARMRLLNDIGITTVKQLREIPLEKLAATKSLGRHYARLIKNSVSEYCRAKHEEAPDRTQSGKDRESHKISRDLEKKIKRLYKNLNRVNENLKPLWEKKYLKLYIDFKKQFKKLKTRLDSLSRNQKDLPEKDKKTIVKKADTLIITLKKVGKKPKKRKYRYTTQEIQSFSSLLRDIIS